MIQPKYLNLTGLFADRVFRIPPYQRFYSWQAKQRNDLFGDIDTLAAASSDRHHFMATIVCFNTGQKASVGATEYSVFEVVDGQQRITTLVLILRGIAKRLAAGKDREEIEEVLVKRDGNLLLLQTNNANQALFNTYLRDGTCPTSTQIKTNADRTLSDGIAECEAYVERWVKGGKGLLEILRLVKNRLGFVVYDTEDRQAVYTVFEVLNSRGLEVDWLDKCKSALMGRAFETAKTEPVRLAAIDDLEKNWGKIYTRLACLSVPGHEVLRVTASTRCESDAGKPLSAEVSLTSLKALCTTPVNTQEVAGWLYASTDTLVSLEEQRHLGPVADVLQARVLAVALRLATQLSSKEKETCLDQWERVTFRIYGLLRKDSRSKVGDYIRLARSIMRQEAGAKSFAEILPALKKLGKDAAIDKAVQEGLVEQNCYESFADECRYILWRYEEHLAAEAGATVNKELRASIWNARTAAETVEHILPQTPKPGGPWDGKLNAGEAVGDHVHRIGNLLLLPKPLNSEAQRKGFVDKKVAYAKNEGLRMVGEVIRLTDWTQATIEAREKRIVAWAKKAWADLP